MKHLIDSIGALIFIGAWVAGMVLAQGFFSTVAAIFLPPWGWCLLAERALAVAGWI